MSETGSVKELMEKERQRQQKKSGGNDRDERISAYQRELYTSR